MVASVATVHACARAARPALLSLGRAGARTLAGPARARLVGLARGWRGWRSPAWRAGARTLGAFGLPSGAPLLYKPHAAHVTVAPTVRSTFESQRSRATIAVLLALVAAALEGTVVTTAMPTITLELGDRALYGWVFSAFLVANAVSVLVCGKLADSLGRRPTFALGAGLFLLGSALSASAPSVPWLIAFRVLQGLGAGGIQPVAMTITTDLYTLQERARIQGLLTAVWGAANVAGPILGGLIVGQASWRWVFVAPAPFALIAVFVLAVSYKDTGRSGLEASGLGGATLGGLTVSLALVALERRFEHRAVAAGLAVACAVALLIKEAHSRAPILPRHVLVEPVVRAGFLGGAFGGGILYLASAYVPLWMIEHARQDMRLAGLPLIALLGGWAVGSTFGVRIFIARGLAVSAGGGYLLACVAAIGMVWASKSTGPGPLLVCLTVVGLGLGPAASTSLVAPQNHVAPGFRGMVTSACYATRMLGGSLAIALVGALAPAGETALFALKSIAVMSGVGAVVMIVLSPRRP